MSIPIITTKNKNLIVIAGPTASGKTSLAIRLAQSLNTEIVSADSRQFYKELNIGTAKPTPQELAAARHHFIGHLSVNERYDVSRYETDAIALLDRLFQTHDNVILCGGSGLYIDAVTKGIDALPDPDPEIRVSLKKLLETQGIAALQEELKRVDPEYYEIVDLSNPIRLIRAIEVYYTEGKKFSSLRNGIDKERNFNIDKYCISIPREQLVEKINLRVDEMMKQGLLEEVKSLVPLRHLTALNTVGYKELFEYLDGNCTLDFAVEKIKTDTRRYAKRQVTWFRRDNEYQWLSSEEIFLLLLQKYY
ncbi:MAG: tRNA (adenosine(37)-N6)-dimethylallyltransferase MiaA [Bacteroidales bacterium]|nr:tRNA (adenosine(37)-N6)-dimethylallyltransferase MiaA [Bacteroidales bacterium]